VGTRLVPVHPAASVPSAPQCFSALCYGGMVSGPDAPLPADCYRYSLAQPGVVGCISAPRRRRELNENLATLRAPTLDPAQLAMLRAHGLGVRAENQRFNTLMRQPPATPRPPPGSCSPPSSRPRTRARRACCLG
jgi:hypothetical protein